MPTGQCPAPAAENSTFCQNHGPITPHQGLKHYLITNKLLGQSPERHNAVDEIKSLREEIVLARALIETRLNLSQNETELISSMGILHSYLTTVQNLVQACFKMDQSLGNLLDKAAVLSLAQDMVGIISEELGDIPGKDVIVDKIAGRLLTAIGDSKNA